MTEDPVKLYVIVMAILLCVLSYVAYDSYRRADAIESAIERAPREAEQLRELASEVKALVDQLAKTDLREGNERVLVERVQKSLRIAHSGFDAEDVPLGRGVKGVERRIIVDFGGGRSSPALSRSQIVGFCQNVESASRGIVKTIEIKINRATGEGYPEPAREEIVKGDMYKGRLIFGLRVVE